MSVKFNAELLKDLITRYGGVEKLISDWHIRFGEKGVPDKATVHRWMNGERLPGNSAKLLCLSALLDVDPFCLFAPEKGTAKDAINAVFRSYQRNALAKPSLKFVADFFGWRDMWPPAYWDNAGTQQPFNWHTQEFSHDANDKANFYAQIALMSDPDIYQFKPQTFHFAYNGRSTFSTSWLQYGFVVRHGHSISLFHIHGNLDAYEASVLDDPSYVETWFGPGDANFRVASLHPFSLKFLRDGDGGPGRVRFPG